MESQHYKRIMILNTAIATLNIGDEIIYESFLNNMDDIIKSSYTMTYPTHTPPLSFIQRILTSKKFNLYKNVDFKFIAGTNLLYTNMLRPFPGWNINIFNHTSVDGAILVGVGAGTNSQSINLYTKLLYQRTLSNKYAHSVRDDMAKRMVEEIGLKAVNTGCVTLWGLDENLCHSIPRAKSNTVVFTLTYYTPDPPKDKLLIDTLMALYDHIYFWPQCIEDLSYLRSLNSNLDKIKIIAPNLKSYKHFLQSVETDFVGTRLHGGIYAMQHAKRSLIIEIDYRVKQIKESYQINTISRDMIVNLGDILNSSISTEINIPTEQIKLWKSQFI